MKNIRNFFFTRLLGSMLFWTTPTPERWTQGSEHNQCFGPDIASAAVIAPTYGYHWVTGAAAIDTMTPPWATFSGEITLVFAGAATTTLAGNFAIAVTAVANQAIKFVYRPAIQKWYPVKY